MTELNLGDLRLVFGGQTKVSSQTPTSVQTKDEEIKANQIVLDGLETETIQTSEEQLEFMRIENPARFEQLMIEGELVDAGSQEQEH